MGSPHENLCFLRKPIPNVQQKQSQSYDMLRRIRASAGRSLPWSCEIWWNMWTQDSNVDTFHTFSHVFTCFHTWNVWNGGMAYQRQPNVPQCRNDARLGLRGASDLLTAEASTHNGLWSGESSLSGWTKYHWKYPLVMTNIAIENDHS